MGRADATRCRWAGARRQARQSHAGTCAHRLRAAPPSLARGLHPRPVIPTRSIFRDTFQYIAKEIRFLLSSIATSSITFDIETSVCRGLNVYGSIVKSLRTYIAYIIGTVISAGNSITLSERQGIKYSSYFRYSNWL